MTDRELVLGVLRSSFSPPTATAPATPTTTAPATVPATVPATAPTPPTCSFTPTDRSRRPTRDAVIYASNNIGISTQLIERNSTSLLNTLNSYL